MSHVTILALGSLGDILPFTTLGKALVKTGHQIRFISFENYGDLIAEAGFDFHPIRGDMRHLMGGGGGQALAASGQNPLRMAWSVYRLFGVMAAGFAQDLSDPVLGATDLIINQLPGGLYGVDLAERFDIPMVLAAVIPMISTRAEPMLAFPQALAFIPGYNSLTYRLAYQLVWQCYRSAVSRWRKNVLDLSAAPFFGYEKRLSAQCVPIINGFSSHIVPRPADWGDHVHISGYWFPEPEPWQPPDDMVNFIESGSPPVFIGFGSMPLSDPAATTTEILEAIRLSGQRAILHLGWAGLGRQDLPANVWPIEYAPYQWLFPRTAATVHHGGSGTTAFALRAGRPTIIIPFLFDQFYWGRRVFALGAGPPALPRKRLSAVRLAELIDLAVNDTGMQSRAAELGQKLRQEEGLARAVFTIQGFLE